MSTATATPPVTRSAFGRSGYMDPKKIRVDERYQRSNTRIVGSIVRNFNSELFEPLTVSERAWVVKGDRHFAVDGGNRLKAALTLGLKEVPVRIVRTESAEEEAELFTKLNQERVPVTVASKHRANVFAKHSLSVALEEAMNEVGFTLIADKVNENTVLIKTISAMYYVWGLGDNSEYAVPGIPEEERLDGQKLVQTTLTLISQTWGSRDKKKQKPLAWNNNTVRAVAIFVEHFWPSIDLSDLANVMKQVVPAEIKVEADRFSLSPNNFRQRAYAFAQAYNRVTGRRLHVTELLS